MLYGKRIAAAMAALLFQVSPVMAERACPCEANGDACKCEKTLEQIAEEWENRCRCNVPDLKPAAKAVDATEATATDNAEDAEANGEEAKKEKPRFVEILRDDSFIYWMDCKTACYTNLPHSIKERMIDVWIKLEPVEYLEGEYTYPAKYYLEHYLIRPKTQQVQFLCELEVTGRPSNEVLKNAYDPRRWENLVPGSIEDSVYHAVLRNKGYIRDEASSNGTSIRDYIENTFNVSL